MSLADALKIYQSVS